MAATWTKSEIEDAALVLVIDEEGNFTWSSIKPVEQIATALETIAEGLRTEEVSA